MVSLTDVGELAALIAKATSEDLADGGRYFAETYVDLTRCRHEEIGEYQNRHDGPLIEWLWNHRHTILAALAEAAPVGDGRVEALEEAAKVADGYNFEPVRDERDSARNAAAQLIATHIRSLAKKVNGR